MSMYMYGNFRMMAAAVIVGSAYSMIDCTDVVMDSADFVGNCDNKWFNLQPLVRPTQFDVGYAWVQRKVDNDFGNDDEAKDELDDAIPAVLGPGPSIYIVDSHHTLAALDYSGLDAKVTIDVICDWRNLTSMNEFWSAMESSGLTYLLTRPAGERDTLPEPRAADELPESFSFNQSGTVFGDDVWRSLAGFSRKYKSGTCDDYKYCDRCFIRNCDLSGQMVPFIEYKWAYFFNDVDQTSSWWPSSSEQKAFWDAFAALPYPSVMGEIDVDDWQATADLLIPLCRGEPAGRYQVPSEYFEEGGGLPGYTEGDTELPDDPTCDAKTCPGISSVTGK